MANLKLPEDCAKQWEILLLLIASEEKKIIDLSNRNEVKSVEYFLENEGIKQILLQWLRQMKSTYGREICDTDTALKSDKISEHWRLLGNGMFKKNLIPESYRCYNKSVAYATPNGHMFSLAFGNRSAALIKMKKYKECLSDIDYALCNGYPMELHHKLYLRQADCYIELNQRGKAIDSITEATQQVKVMKEVAARNVKKVRNQFLSKNYAEDFDRHLKILQHKLNSRYNAVISDDTVELPPLLNGENPHFVSASNVLQVRNDPNIGRFVTTLDDIKSGDILFSEEPYAWVPLPCELTVCDGCCETDINLIPCRTCSRTVYCSDKCRVRALDYHRYECVGAQANLFPTIGIAHLALRVLLKSAINGFPKFPPEVPEPTSVISLFEGYASVDNVAIYSLDTPAFYRMFNLVTNFEKMKIMDFIQYALTATMLTLYLENFTSFFDTFQRTLAYRLRGKQLRTFAAALLLRALGQLVCNGHAALSLATVDYGDENVVSEREVRRATAIYPSAAMMNHSCDPNIVNTFYKKRLIVRVSRNLSGGAQVLNCYGPHHTRETTWRRRQQLLAQYLFTCHCNACLDIDRRFTVLKFTAFKCMACNEPILRNTKQKSCRRCQMLFDLKVINGILEKADSLLLEVENTKSEKEQIEKLLEALRLRKQVFYTNNEALRPVIDNLARVYANIGEYEKSLELINENVESLEAQFGSSSVEVAHELRKLSDVMLERLLKSERGLTYRAWCLEAETVVKRAFELMELNFGSWEPAVKRLKTQKNVVAALLGTYV